MQQNELESLREKIDGFFTQFRGSRKAFCEKEGISIQTLWLLLSGKIYNIERLNRAALFIEKWAKMVLEAKDAKVKAAVENLEAVVGNLETDRAEQPGLN